MDKNMTVDKARKILGNRYAEKTDEEIQQMIETLRTLANITIDTVLKMTLEKRKELEKEFKTRRK